jgi:Flp pilus assembly protein TadD
MTVRAIDADTTFDQLAGLLIEYRLDPNEGLAGDLLSAAITTSDRRPEILSIATSLRSASRWTLIEAMCDHILDDETRRMSARFDLKPTDSRERIGSLRSALRAEPRNSLRWVDLAREHLILGDVDKSNKAMRIALNLAPHNRFVLRSASTLLVQNNDLEQALVVLGKSPRAMVDPWLLAPQIAITDLAETRQSVVRAARRVLEDDHPAIDLAELRAALGTLEIGSGSHRRGRQYLRWSLDSPTENALAQVEWSSQNLNQSMIGEMPTTVPRAFEAQARRASFEARWADGIQQSLRWCEDQPFGFEPYIHGSFSACEDEQWTVAIDFARNGVKLHPQNMMLLNNLAFAQIGAGYLVEAADTLLRARETPERGNGIVRAATEAQFLFRVGDESRGRRRYKSVIRSFTSSRKNEEAARAALMLSQEEFLANSNESSSSWKRAIDLVGESKFAPLVALKNRIDKLRRSGPLTIAHLSETTSWPSRDRLIEEPAELD